MLFRSENIGHFGLAAEYYTHFTSPIRRYPDLIVHRLLHEWVSDPAMNAQKSEKLELNLDAIAEHSSIRERAAAEAERATVDLKKAEYMAGHIGEEFDGVISGVTAFGMFIELENGVEGLVHISSLMDDYYEFYEDRYALLGSHTRKVYRLGDPVRIEVLQVNIADRNIDFIMAGENDAVRDRIKAQLLGQRSHASARSAIEKSGGKKQGKSGSRKKPLEKRGKGGVGGNKYVNHAKSKKKGRKKK
nr:RNB domain-containing ribonuclease [uncultured Phascolarctobacterium sp.]